MMKLKEGDAVASIARLERKSEKAKAESKKQKADGAKEEGEGKSRKRSGKQKATSAEYTWRWGNEVRIEGVIWIRDVMDKLLTNTDLNHTKWKKYSAMRRRFASLRRESEKARMCIWHWVRRTKEDTWPCCSFISKATRR